LVFVAIALVLTFVLNLNDTVKFKEGNIYSDTPQLKINAPDEVRVLRVAVKEGQEVKKGDTLFELENKKTAADYNVLTTDIQSMEHKIEIIKVLISNTQERKKALQQLLQIQSTIYATDRKKTDIIRYSMYQKAYIGQEIKKINCDLTKKTIFLPMKKKEQSTIVN
jgi:multidrug efflux pump subunit AcrA (membrane-fusion protein)